MFSFDMVSGGFERERWPEVRWFWIGFPNLSECQFEPLKQEVS